MNAAFSAAHGAGRGSLQAGYVELLPTAPTTNQPAVVALPVPRPYGRRQVTLANLAASLPEAIGEFIRWLIADSGWTVPAPMVDGAPIAAGDVCLLFRRFIAIRTM